MNITCFSDIHGHFDRINLRGGDVLIFCGDIGNPTRTLEEVERFALFMEKLPYHYKIAIAGNHDFPLDDDRRVQAENILKKSGITYLNESSVIIDGVHFWGSPVSPFFHNWAFNCKGDDSIRKRWNKIPADVDVLITHTPPYGILDVGSSGEHIGCPELLEVVEGVNPKYHIFGHVHHSYGSLQYLGICYVNASSLRKDGGINDPICFDY